MPNDHVGRPHNFFVNENRSAVTPLTSAGGRKQPHPSTGTGRAFRDSSNAPGSRRSALPNSLVRDHLQSLQTVQDLERRGQEEERLGILRRIPYEKQSSAASGVFVWPMQLGDPFSSGAESKILDHIRNEHHCHVVHDQALSCFRIYSSDQHADADVGNAMYALKTALCEQLASSTKQLRSYMAIPPVNSNGAVTIQIISVDDLDGHLRAAGTGVPGKTEVVALLTRQPPLHSQGQGAAFIKLIPDIRRKNPLVLATATRRSLERLQYRQGRIRIRVLLGIFLFTRYITTQQCGLPGFGWETASQFVSNLRSAKTEGALHRLTSQSQLLQRAYQCGDLLEQAGGEHSAGSGVNIYHTGNFTFAAPSLGDPVDIQLRYYTSQNLGPGGLAPKKLRQEWTTTDDPISVRCLELFMITFGSGMSWKLEIAAQRSDRSIPPAMQAFAQSVKILPPSVTCDVRAGNAELMFDIGNSILVPKDFNQKTSWRFRLKADPGYILEVSRLDRFDMSTMAANRSSNGIVGIEQRRPRATEWEACVYHEQWDEYMGQNLALSTGQRANWHPSLDTFFPYNNNNNNNTGESMRMQGTGFEHFLHLVQEVIDRLSGVNI